MNSDYNILSWDTEFFGIKVASVTPSRLSPARLGQIMESLRRLDVSLVYWPADPADDESQDAAKKFEGFLADRKTTYSIDLNDSVQVPAPAFKNDIEEYTGSIVCPELVNLAIDSGIYSRFRLDKHLSPGKYEELYKIWISKSVDKSVADAVFVARDKERIVAMVTVSRKDQAGVIGLIAVDEAMRGKSMGRDLVVAAHNWYLARGCTKGLVTTQGMNQAACKLYERCGYTVELTHNYYHFWLKSA